MSVLRTLPVTPKTVPALFMFDEAGNIPIHGLREMLGVGRGRKVAVVLAYQNLGQVYAHYGSDGADPSLVPSTRWSSYLAWISERPHLQRRESARVQSSSTRL